MTDLEEALCNPLLVTDERFDLTRKAAAEIKRLKGLFDKWHTIAAEKHAEIEQLKAALRHIQGVAEQAEVFHPQLGASRTFARITEAARATLAGKVQP